MKPKLTYGRGKILESIRCEAQKQRALSNPRIPNQQQLEQVIKFNLSGRGGRSIHGSVSNPKREKWLNLGGRQKTGILGIRHREELGSDTFLFSKFLVMFYSLAERCKDKANEKVERRSEGCRKAKKALKN